MDQIYKVGAQSALFTCDAMGVKPTELRELYRDCPVKEIFPTEADLEAQILHDPEAHKVIGEQAGLTVMQVERQVRTTRMLAQRMDLVASSFNPADPKIVVELMLGSLDSDHVIRAIGYAFMYKANHAILVASGFSQHSYRYLEEWEAFLKRERITIHLMHLRTGIKRDGTASYTLDPVTPAKAPDRRQPFLEALIPVVTALGDDSLLNCNVTGGKRLESYVGLKNIVSIRLQSGHGNTSISVILRDPQSRQQLLDADLYEKLNASLAPFEPVRGRGPQSSVLTSFGFAIDTSTAVAAEEALERVAGIYVTVRKQVIETISLLQLPPVDPNLRVRFIRSHALSPSLSNAVNAVNRDGTVTS